MSFVDGLKEAGVVLLIGTDSGIPMKFHNQSTWNELDVGVNKFGIDPMYTIRAVDEAKDKLSKDELEKAIESGRKLSLKDTLQFASKSL